MSAGGFHVNGAREHKLERAAQGGHDDHSNNGEKKQKHGCVNCRHHRHYCNRRRTVCLHGRRDASQCWVVQEKCNHQENLGVSRVEFLSEQKHQAVASAMAAIALFTRKRWVEYLMFAAAAGGIIVGALAALHI